MGFSYVLWQTYLVILLTCKYNCYVYNPVILRVDCAWGRWYLPINSIFFAISVGYLSFGHEYQYNKSCMMSVERVKSV